MISVRCGWRFEVLDVLLHRRVAFPEVCWWSWSWTWRLGCTIAGTKSFCGDCARTRFGSNLRRFGHLHVTSCMSGTEFYIPSSNCGLCCALRKSDRAPLALQNTPAIILPKLKSVLTVPFEIHDCSLQDPYPLIAVVLTGLQH